MIVGILPMVPDILVVFAVGCFVKIKAIKGIIKISLDGQKPSQSSKTD